MKYINVFRTFIYILSCSYILKKLSLTGAVDFVRSPTHFKQEEIEQAATALRARQPNPHRQFVRKRSPATSKSSGHHSGDTETSSVSTCNGYCGGHAGSCYCDSLCLVFHDCCSDACEECNVCESDADISWCEGKCGGYSHAGSCFCDSECVEFGDCCEDACEECGYCEEGASDCSQTVLMTDSWGDGWNGYEFSAYDIYGTVVDTVTLASGWHKSTTLDLACDACYTFMVSATGQYPSEIAYSLCDSSGGTDDVLIFCLDESGTCSIIDGCDGICPQIWAPVCGCDGNTYGNECELLQHAACTASPLCVAHDGACEDYSIHDQTSFSTDAITLSKTEPSTQEPTSFIYKETTLEKTGPPIHNTPFSTDGVTFTETEYLTTQPAVIPTEAATFRKAGFPTEEKTSFQLTGVLNTGFPTYETMPYDATEFTKTDSHTQGPTSYGTESTAILRTDEDISYSYSYSFGDFIYEELAFDVGTTLSGNNDEG